jgi:glycosyltransferase involved in cell wall biosynthesis
MQNPVISIVTVCFQAEKTIERTIQSVLSQSWKNIEFIIIDGGSTDNTLPIIEKYREHISKVVSETDNGLYDAMNKGLKQATGDYILVLNADDLLYEKNTLEKVFTVCQNADVIYGEAIFMNEAGEELGLRSQQTPHKVPENLNWKSLQYGMTVSHQAFIIRRSLAVNYDLHYKICADIDWMIRCLKKCKTTCNTHLIISKFQVGGASKQQQKRAWKERYRIFQKHYGIFPNFFNHIYIGLRYLLGKKY